MPDIKPKTKRKTPDAAAQRKPVFIATAATCIGKVNVSMYPPTKTGHRFVVRLTTKKGDRRAYYRSYVHNKPPTLSERLQMENRNRNLSLIQATDHKFALKHSGLPNCTIEIVDYAVKPPPTKYNGIGLIVASVIGTNATGYEPFEEAPGQEEEEDEDFIDLLHNLLEDESEPAEVVGGPGNVWNAIDDIINEGEGGTDDDDQGGADAEGEWFWTRWWNDLIDWGNEEH